MNLSELKMDEMSVEDKLSLVTAIWDNITSGSENVSPKWHEDVLNERAESSDFSDWNSAKDRLNSLL